MATGVDLYKALRPKVGEVAARMIAEALPMTDRVATKSDLGELVTKSDLHAMEARIFRWMLGFFATLWLGNAGVIVTLLIRG
jgi:hypothetical protein